MRIEIDQINTRALLIDQMILLRSSTIDLFIWRGTKRELSTEFTPQTTSTPRVVSWINRLQRRVFIRKKCFLTIPFNTVEPQTIPAGITITTPPRCPD